MKQIILIACCLLTLAACQKKEESNRNCACGPSCACEANNKSDNCGCMTCYCE